MAKTKIPGWAFLVVGLVVLTASYYLNRKKMVLFMIVAVLFIAIGIIKLIFSKAREKKEVPVHLTHKFCAFCGANLPLHARFCPRCGQLSMVKANAGRHY